MNDFSELVQHATTFTLDALGSAQQRAINELQSGAATPLIKLLQMAQLQKAISAVGMFSMFDAILQEDLNCNDGFRKAEELLKAGGEIALKERFCDLRLAVNIIKHGRGRSYDDLVKKVGSLPFRMKLLDETFFCEGDVAEVSTLVEVDDAFVQLCAEVIHDVSFAINSMRQHGA